MTTNNKALHRANSRNIVREAYQDAYNPKNREFLYGGRTVRIPTQAKEDDILDLCLALKGIKVNLLPLLEPIKDELQAKDVF